MARNAHTCTCTCTCICKLHSNFKVSKLWQIELLFGTFKGATTSRNYNSVKHMESYLILCLL